MRKHSLYKVRKISTLKEMLNQSAELFADKTAFLVKENRSGAYSPISYRRFADDVKALGTEFIGMGLLKDTKIAIVSENRYFWGVTYMAAVNGEAVVIPIDKELAAEDIINLLEVSGASAVGFGRSGTVLISSHRRCACLSSTTSALSKPSSP